MTNGEESPKCSRSSFSARADSVPGTTSEVGCSFPTIPIPAAPSTATATNAIASVARGLFKPRSAPLTYEELYRYGPGALKMLQSKL